MNDINIIKHELNAKIKYHKDCIKDLVIGISTEAPYDEYINQITDSHRCYIEAYVDAINIIDNNINK